MRRGAGCGALLGACVIFVALCAVLQWADTQDQPTFDTTFRFLVVIGTLTTLLTAWIIIGEHK